MSRQQASGSPDEEDMAMKRLIPLVLAVVVLFPAAAFAGAATDAALALGAFAVFNQIVAGTGVFGGVVAGPAPVYAAPPPPVYAPAYAPVYAAPVYVVPRPVYVAPRVVHVAPRHVFVHSHRHHGHVKHHGRHGRHGHRH